MKSRSRILWNNIVARTNPESAECKRYPKYIGTQNLFESFDSFEQWCRGSEGFGLLDSDGNAYALDKDLAILSGDVEDKGYGQHCVFIPAKLNSVVKIVYGSGSQLPGITPYRGNRYRMQYRDIQGNKHHGGIYQTEQEAHKAWKRIQVEVFNDASGLCIQLGLTKAAHMFKRASIRFKEKQ